MAILLCTTIHALFAATPAAHQEPREAGTERTVELGADLSLPLAWVPPGEFVMGSPTEEQGRCFSYLPAGADFTPPGFEVEAQHEVTFERGFWVGQTEVTQAQYEAVTGENPSRNRGPALPVENVSWFEAHAFLDALNEGRADGRFRLLTEAQWEYAARAGARGRFAADVDRMGWQRGNSQGRSHEVATLEPNAWGLFDMHGNVTEWCQDWYGDIGSDPVTEPAGVSQEVARGKQNGDLAGRRLARGGSFTGRVLHCRSADRGCAPPESRSFTGGFRVAFDVAVDVGRD